MIKNNRAAIYVRVSTEEQAKEGYSIDAQVNILKLYCKLFDYEVIEIYKDEGISGKDLNRKNLKRLLQDAQKNVFDVVVVWKVSRLSRNLSNLLSIVDNLDSCGVSFISQSETFNTSTPVGRMTLQILGSIAEFERNTIIENIKLALNEKAMRGEWLGGRVFGYKNVNKKLELNQKEAEIVKYIFNSYLDGKSIKEILKFMHQNNILTVRSKKKYTGSIYRILKNPIYCGILSHKSNGEVIQVAGVHEPIISKTIFKEVQDKIRNKKTEHKDTGEFILVGLLKCPFCQSNLIRYKTLKYRYYRCSKYHNYGKEQCRGFIINANNIENQVYKIIEKKISTECYKTLYDSFDVAEVFNKNFVLELNNFDYSKRKNIIRHFIDKIILTQGKTIDRILFKKD